MKYIFVQPLGGLCNRMRAIAGASKLAKLQEKKLIVLWTRDASLNAHFEDIFANFPYKVIDIPLNSIIYKIILHVLKDVFRFRILDDEWINTNARRIEYAKWKDEVKNKNLLICADRDIFLDEDYSFFKVNKNILRYNQISNLSSMIGVHIRRVDNEMSIRMSPTSLFIKKIEYELGRNPDATFYLATDDHQEEKKIKDIFGDRIIIYQKRSLDRNDPIAIFDAVIDLYNLAHCKKIYGSYYSSFSDIAAVWGNTPKEVLKIDNS